MKKVKSVPSPITILMAIIVLAAIATWLIPAGKYNTITKSEGESFTLSTPKGDTSLAFTQHLLDSLQIKIPLEKFASGAIRKPVSIPGSYQQLERNKQGFLQILNAPIKGIYDTIDIILFILVIGGFMHVFNESGAMVKGLTSLTHTMKGKESWLIIILTFLFSFGGASYGMAEEGLVFYPIMVPLFLAAGYDLIVPVAVIFAGTQLGTLSSFSNPFSVIVASNAAGISWQNGIWERIIMFVLSTALTIGYIIRYGNKIKKDPTASFVYKVDGNVASPYPGLATTENVHQSLDVKTKLLLVLFISTFLIMIFGVVKLEWWLPEMTALFLGASILLAVILRLNEKDFINQFIKGAESLLSVAFIVGVARGVTIILNEGKISDSILYYSAKMVGGFPPVLFIIILLALYMVFTLFISSSSGMAVLTMPIIGALAILVNVPGKEVVNAYLFGMGIMGFITPTGLILPSLALVNVSFKAWMKFVFPLLLMLFILCAVFLVGGLYW
ncbi:MAG: YfcC family protein [Chitinophagaceae bacterium]|nr:YfcC family protein [Chitinophagaceae bacterium]